MLLDLLDFDLMSSGFCVQPEELMSALYVSSEFTNKYFLLNLIRDLGYLERLI